MDLWNLVVVVVVVVAVVVVVQSSPGNKDCRSAACLMRQQKDETSEVFTDMFPQPQPGGDAVDPLRRAFAGDAFEKPLTCYTMETCFAL